MLGLLFILPISVISADRSVRVAWDPNPESNIKGYRIYHGVVNAGSTNVMDVGPSTVGSVTDLSYETQYFFYVTAYNDYDLESDPSAILYYTTTPQIPVSVTTDEILLAFAPVELRIPAELEGDVGSNLEISWDQLTGPAPVTIQNGDSVEPTVQLTTIGDYSFQVSVSDDSSSDQSQVKITVIEPPTGSGTEAPLTLEPPLFLPDGVALYWNSTADPNIFYQVGMKRDLNSQFWIVLGKNIPSEDGYTYWVDDSIDLSTSGFYTVFGSAFLP